MSVSIGGAVYGAVVAVSLLVAPSNASAAPALAFWANYDEIVHLDNLSKSYGCDELFYKVRDILLAVGVRPGVEIYVYDCAHGRGESARSPRIHVIFYAPMALPMTARQTARTLSVNQKFIRLRPGDPKSLDAADCILLDEMGGTVLRSVSKHMDATGLNCRSIQAARGQFGLVVDALIPIA